MSKFTTKKYTRPFLINELNNMSTSSYASYKQFVNSFSPNKGVRSAKFAALTKLVSRTGLNLVLATAPSNRAAKTKLVSALKNA